jgi:DNA-binding transcriptional ArsR family regulator
MSIGEMKETLGLSYSNILHHLNRLREEGVVERIGEKRPFRWKITELGQQRLSDYLG